MGCPGTLRGGAETEYRVAIPIFRDTVCDAFGGLAGWLGVADMFFFPGLGVFGRKDCRSFQGRLGSLRIQRLTRQ